MTGLGLAIIWILTISGFLVVASLFLAIGAGTFGSDREGGAVAALAAFLILSVLTCILCIGYFNLGTMHRATLGETLYGLISGQYYEKAGERVTPECETSCPFLLEPGKEHRDAWLMTNNNRNTLVVHIDHELPQKFIWWYGTEVAVPATK